MESVLVIMLTGIVAAMVSVSSGALMPMSTRHDARN